MRKIWAMDLGEDEVRRSGKSGEGKNVIRIFCIKIYFHFYSFHVKRTRDTVQW